MRTDARGWSCAAVLAAAGLVAAAGCAPRARRAGPPGPNPNSANAADWNGQPVGQVEELFSGRFPGVQVYAAEGGIVVRIRGTTTLTGNSEPLYVIDGLAVPPGSNGLIGINPADVARIEVVKDAADLAGYGSRAGNGVVRITTKRTGR